MVRFAARFLEEVLREGDQGGDVCQGTVELDAERSGQTAETTQQRFFDLQGGA